MFDLEGVVCLLYLEHIHMIDRKAVKDLQYLIHQQAGFKIWPGRILSSPPEGAGLPAQWLVAS